ncbi:MAG: DNA/RNA non-specific endonuclease [Muribaculaceae bacterium]|nr:DNA/RNA non-specific endonuclease [Muribaculaceae bacterium]
MKRIFIIAILLLGITLPSAELVPGDGITWVMNAQARSKKARKQAKRLKKQEKRARKQAAKGIVPLIGASSTTSQPTNALCRVVLPKGMNNQTLNYKAITIYFNNKLRIPNCVAYELTATMVSMADAPTAEKRKNYQFVADSRAAGSPDGRDYRGSGYTRGHMAPAMDMRGDRQTMLDCFAMTNMCPQEAKLNNDHWRQLEENVHRWAKRDGRLIVLTGPIVAATGHSCIGPRHDIAVPCAFYKVIYAPQQGRAIAFIYDNAPSPGGLARHAVTVDEVERRTGMDFFTALGRDTERNIEAQCNIDAWK